MNEQLEHYVDLATGEVQAKELDAEFIAARDSLNAENELLAQEAEAQKITLEHAKIAAQAKLEALGLTTDDLKALGL
jgi:serine phosphatase RsbU (regulator of sigma subunit)